MQVLSSEIAPFPFKLLLLGIFILKLGVFKGDPEHCPSSWHVPWDPRPLPAVQQPLGSSTRHKQHLPAHIVCQWFGPPLLHHTGMCLNLIDFSRTRELYWADVLVGWNAGATPPPLSCSNLPQRAKDTQRWGWDGWTWLDQTRNPSPELGEFWIDAQPSRIWLWSKLVQYHLLNYCLKPRRQRQHEWSVWTTHGM